MVSMFGDCTVHGTSTLDRYVASGQPLDMENYFSRLALDIIGKAVFNYDFDSLTHDDPVIKVRAGHNRNCNCSRSRNRNRSRSRRMAKVKNREPVGSASTCSREGGVKGGRGR